MIRAEYFRFLQTLNTPSAPEAASQAQVDEDTLVESSEKQTTSAAETL